MKNFFLFLAAFFAITAFAHAQTEPDASPIKMVKEKYDVGKIPSGKPYTFYMEFVNQTKKPLVVKNVMAGCGCTVPEKPTEPIMPGKTGKIKVVYTPASPSPINKDVEIYLAGYNEPKIVYFTGQAI